ncbi:MAG TPA: hypothetical protein VKT49_08710 [Bryobacteraceae bacterium]|nr:hypothetical protein [Bryobacteraceae bacterium]
MAATANERLAAARGAVDEACQLLLSPSPEQMDRCARLLETARTELIAFRQCHTVFQESSAKTGSLAQARSLESSLHRVKRLLEGAAAFHANWIRCLAAMCAGYTDQGQPAPLQRGGHLLARG